MSSTSRTPRTGCSCARAGRASNRPDPFDEHRDEPATTRRAAEATTRVKSLSCQGWKAHTARLRPAPSTRPGPAACSPRKDNAPDRPWTGRRRPSPSPTPSPDQQNSHAAPDRAEPEHLADDPRTGPAPTRNRHRQDRGRPGQRPPPPRQSPDRPPRARPAAGTHHTDPSAAIRARPQPRRARPEHGQEQHHHHPARDPRRNPRNIRLTHHRPHRRPRLRTPPTPRNQKRSCSMTAIDRFRLSQ